MAQTASVSAPISMTEVRELLRSLRLEGGDAAGVAGGLQRMATAAGAHPDNSAKIGPNGIKAVLACLSGTHCKENQDAAVAGCRAIGALANKNFINKKRLSSTSFAPIIAAVMEAHTQSPAVIVEAVGALGKIADANKQNAAHIVRAHVDDTLLAALALQDSDEGARSGELLDKTAQMLAVIGANSVKLMAKIAGDVVAAMTAASADDRIPQRNACHILAYLLNADADADGLQRTRDAVAEKGAAKLLRRALAAAIAQESWDTNDVVVRLPSCACNCEMYMRVHLLFDACTTGASSASATFASLG